MVDDKTLFKLQPVLRCCTGTVQGCQTALHNLALDTPAEVQDTIKCLQADMIALERAVDLLRKVLAPGMDDRWGPLGIAVTLAEVDLGLGARGILVEE